MHVDMLGRPIEVGDTIAFSINDRNSTLITAKVVSFASTSKGKSCVRVDDNTYGLRNAHRVLVITREIEYTKEHYPELML